ncbi:hypothetical protein EDC27_1649 [Desulfosoma caldarium]|uniref:Uncharacterized protein n=1 Tax=Desulfosoma caldarium TaxID=610254 RepID=A0A3N1URA1_9BACT|nr:hypothetical protein EDC27_1649 [Desulfosoma caldarium]
MVSYIQTISPLVFCAKHGLIFYKRGCCERNAGGVLYCDVVTQKCYEKII